MNPKTIAVDSNVRELAVTGLIGRSRILAVSGRRALYRILVSEHSVRS
jgi:hypothetical protein